MAGSCRRPRLALPQCSTSSLPQLNQHLQAVNDLRLLKHEDPSPEKAGSSSFLSNLPADPEELQMRLVALLEMGETNFSAFEDALTRPPQEQPHRPQRPQQPHPRTSVLLSESTSCS